MLVELGADCHTRAKVHTPQRNIKKRRDSLVPAKKATKFLKRDDAMIDKQRG